MEKVIKQSSLKVREYPDKKYSKVVPGSNLRLTRKVIFCGFLWPSKLLGQMSLTCGVKQKTKIYTALRWDEMRRGQVSKGLAMYLIYAGRGKKSKESQKDVKIWQWGGEMEVKNCRVTGF